MHILAPSSLTAAQLLEVGCELPHNCLCISEKYFWQYVQLAWQRHCFWGGVPNTLQAHIERRLLACVQICRFLRAHELYTSLYGYISC